LILRRECGAVYLLGVVVNWSGTLVSRIVFHMKGANRLHMKGARRASICSSMSGDIGVAAVDPAAHVRGQELVMVGEMPVERSAQLI
jgi:hypothetical protein